MWVTFFCFCFVKIFVHIPTQKEKIITIMYLYFKIQTYLYFNKNIMDRMRPLIYFEIHFSPWLKFPLPSTKCCWHGGVVVSTVVSQQQGSWFEPSVRLGPFWSLHVLHVAVWVLLVQVLNILPQSKDITGVKGWLPLCVGPATHPGFTLPWPVTAGKGC